MSKILSTITFSLALLSSVLQAQVPQLLNYQGRIIVDGINFSGAGQFKFALVNGSGDTAYWSNDASLDSAITVASEPAAAVALAVSNGLYSVLLGDTTLANMSAIPVGIFANLDVRLRVWFNDGQNGFQLLTPDQRIAAVGYAVTAGSMRASALYDAPARPVVAWGDNDDGQTNVPPDLTDVRAIAAGADHSLALRNDGSVVAWGRDQIGQVSGTATIVAIIDDTHYRLSQALAAATDDLTYSGATALTLSSTSNGTDVVTVADTANLVPGMVVSGAGLVDPDGLSGIVAIAAGTYHSLAVKGDGGVVAWGRTGAVPPGLASVTAVAAGDRHSLALKSDGTVAAWGDTAFNQTTVPGGLTGVTAIACGNDHSLALKSDGTVVAWGRDDSGQVTGTAPVVGTIVAILDGTRYVLSKELAPATAVLSYTGTGTVNLNSVSDGSEIVTVTNTIGLAPGMIVSGPGFVSPGGLSNIVAIGAGAFHSLAVKADGTVVAWGWDLGGQSSVPADLSGVVAVAGGYSHSVAVRSDGTVAAWGDNTLGQADIPERLGNVVSIAATGSHTLALRAPQVPVVVARLDEKNFFTEAIGIGRVPSKNMLEVEGVASKAIAGNWAANSDRRIKQEIQPVRDAMRTLEGVRLVSFRYTEAYRAAHAGVGDGRYLNVIAQEFAQVFPEHVRASGEFLPDGSEILQVDTYPLTIYAAAAIQELNQKLIENQEEVAELKERLAQLERLILQNTNTAGVNP